jgi:hypothetical protein
MKFAELLKARPGVSPPQQQQEAIRHFPDLVKASNLRLWPSEDASQVPHLRLVVGTACWSVPDLELLDRINEKLGEVATQGIHIEVFDAGSGVSLADIAVRVPGLPKIFHTPVVGVWRDGHLSSSEQGARARKLIEHLLSLSG